MLLGQKISESLGLRVKYHSEETKEQISKTLTLGGIILSKEGTGKTHSLADLLPPRVSEPNCGES